MEQSLSGVRVLDFTRVLAGPLCTMILGDRGADVLKIENPHRGDDTRQWGPPWVGEQDPQSAYFLSVNRNKRSLTLDLKQPQAIELIKQLLSQSQILIENFKVGQMRSYGLDYESLRQINPALVYCSISGFGQTGPYRDRPGYDYVVQAMSGLMSITGPADGLPHKVGVAISDVIAGLYASNAILSALRHSEKTGEGQYIDISLLDTQLAAMVNIASNYLVSGEVPQRLGNLHPNIVPYQTFQAQDGEFVLAVGNDRQFALLCQLLRQEQLITDDRFQNNPARVKNRELLVSILQAAFMQANRQYWIEALIEKGIPAGPIYQMDEALKDPHVQARGLVQESRLANDEVFSYLSSPVKMSLTPDQMRYPPPALGQHTDEILADLLAYTPEAIQALRSQGII